MNVEDKKTRVDTPPNQKRDDITGSQWQLKEKLANCWKRRKETKNNQIKIVFSF